MYMVELLKTHYHWSADPLSNASMRETFHLKDILQKVNVGGRYIVSCDVTSLSTNVPVIDEFLYIKGKADNGAMFMQDIFNG